MNLADEPKTALDEERLHGKRFQHVLPSNLMFNLKHNWPLNLNGRVYRLVMKVAHRYNWHYAPPIYPEGDTQLWCKWCGFRMTLPRKTGKEIHP